MNTPTSPPHIKMRQYDLKGKAAKKTTLMNKKFLAVKLDSDPK
jgi:hypothetical protein